MHYTYQVLSYDKSGYAGLPMKDPIVVRVNDSSGNPASTVLVEFAITGPGKGAQTVPADIGTDTTGEASATIILGNASGIYNIGVTVAGNTTVYPVTSIELGGG
jgi:hypothetical protein